MINTITEMVSKTDFQLFTDGDRQMVKVNTNNDEKAGWAGNLYLALVHDYREECLEGMVADKFSNDTDADPLADALAALRADPDHLFLLVIEKREEASEEGHMFFRPEFFLVRKKYAKKLLNA